VQEQRRRRRDQAEHRGQQDRGADVDEPRDHAADQERNAGSQQADGVDAALLWLVVDRLAVSTQRLEQQGRRRTGQDRMADAERGLADAERGEAVEPPDHGETHGEERRADHHRELEAEAVGQHAGRDLDRDHAEVVDRDQRPVLRRRDAMVEEVEVQERDARERVGERRKDP
jgi:hypothetical protein